MIMLVCTLDVLGQAFKWWQALINRVTYRTWNILRHVLIFIIRTFNKVWCRWQGDLLFHLHVWKTHIYHQWIHLLAIHKSKWLKTLFYVLKPIWATSFVGSYHQGGIFSLHETLTNNTFPLEPCSKILMGGMRWPLIVFRRLWQVVHELWYKHLNDYPINLVVL